MDCFNYLLRLRSIWIYIRPVLSPQRKRFILKNLRRISAKMRDIELGVKKCDIKIKRLRFLRIRIVFVQIAHPLVSYGSRPKAKYLNRKKNNRAEKPYGPNLLRKSTANNLKVLIEIFCKKLTL